MMINLSDYSTHIYTGGSTSTNQVTHMNETSHTCASHTYIRAVRFHKVLECNQGAGSCAHSHVWMSRVADMNESDLMYESVMQNTRITCAGSWTWSWHIDSINRLDQFIVTNRLDQFIVTHRLDQSTRSIYIWDLTRSYVQHNSLIESMGHVTHLKEACHRHEELMTRRPFASFRCVTLHIWMRMRGVNVTHVTRDSMKLSYSICEFIDKIIGFFCRI